MIDTTPKICKECKYSTGGTNGRAEITTTCYYLVLTGMRRNCPVGKCDKFEKREENEE